MIQSLNELFPHIFIINMDHMQERFIQCGAELVKYNIKDFNRFSGVKINDGLTTLDRELGCKFSHLNIIEVAKLNKWPNVLIFEDDAEFLPDFNKFLPYIENFINNNRDWHLFYLGGNNLKAGEDVPNFKHIVKISNTLTTHAYAINQSVYDELLAFKNDKNQWTNPIDGILRDVIQAKGKSYCLNPRMVTQKICHSYIRNTVCDYSKYLKDK